MLDIEPTAMITVTNVGKYPLKCGDVYLPPGIPVAVPYSFLASYGGNANIVPDFSGLADHLRSRTDTDHPYFDFWAPLSAVDGYGRHAIDLWRGFGMIGAQANFRSVGLEDDIFLSPSFISAVHDNQRLPPAKVSLCFSVPYDSHHHTTGSITRIAMTQFETNHVPVRHVQNVNLANHLVVTSSFQPKVWKESGCQVPISVMTPGIDADFFAYRERPKTGQFRCLILGALSGRKNGAAAIRIFQRASQGDPGWRLTVKNRALKLDREILEMIRRDGRITVIHENTSVSDILQLYYDHDCLIWPAKGEGVGLPPMEAMSTGMEVVISDSSGMKDYTSGKHCYPIRIKGMEDASLDGTFSGEYISNFGGIGSWWLPDEDHGVKQLQNAFLAWYEDRGKGRAAADYIRSHHTLQHQARSVLRVVEEYL